MPDQAVATVQMDQKGRITVPTSTRKVLECDGTSADVTLCIEVEERHD